MSDCHAAIRILVTNTALDRRAGSELYVRDLVLELRRRGHLPMVYSPRPGGVAEEIRRAAIPVVDDVAMIGAPPDLIHAQHHLEAAAALAAFPGVPALYVCHGWLPWEETPLLHPRILRYVAVSEAVRDRIVYERGVDPGKVEFVGNFVDTGKFKSRGPLPPAPRKALLFDNYASDASHAAAIREGCARAGISFDVVGIASGHAVSEPETILGGYDVVFARGRAALESLATGAAVICCGFEGAGAMVTTANVERLLRQNFGIRAMDGAITAAWVEAELRAYDPADAAAVSARVRSERSLAAGVDRLVALYEEVLAEWSERGASASAALELRAEGLAWAAHARWLSRSFGEQPRLMLDLEAERDELATKLRLESARVVELAEASARLRATLTWRLYERFVTSPLLRKAYRAVSAPFGRKAPDEAPRTDATPDGPRESPERRPEEAFEPASHAPSASPALACVVMSVGSPPSLVAAVRSVVAQDEPVEVVVVNSGGGDACAALREAGVDTRVIEHDELLWPGAARNAGILATKAPWVAFLAADCIAEAGWARGRAARHRAGALAVSTAVTNAAPESLASWASHIALFSRRMPGLAAREAVHYGISYDRRLFDRFGLFREDLRTGEDTELNERLRGVAPEWAPEVRAAHLHPSTLPGLLGDQLARGRRMASGLARLTGEDRRWKVAFNALARVPASLRRAWRGCLPSERLRVACAAPLLLPAAACYALGALGAFGRRAPETETELPRRRHRIVALLAARDEAANLAGWLANVAPHVDAIVALDDGSTDGSGDLLAAHPSVVEVLRKPAREPHVWDEPGNRRILVEAAMRHGAEWIVVVDADERLELGFRERAESEIARAGREGHLAFRVVLRELWNAPDRFRADGLWARKHPPRLFRARADHRFDERAFHGFWVPLNSLRDGDCPVADLIVYHLRMIRAADRQARRERYERLDPESEFQSIGYGYLTDETGIVLEAVPEGRHYESVAEAR